MHSAHCESSSNNVIQINVLFLDSRYTFYWPTHANYVSPRRGVRFVLHAVSDLSPSLCHFLPSFWNNSATVREGVTKFEMPRQKLLNKCLFLFIAPFDLSRNCTIFGAQGDLGRPFDFSTFDLGLTSRDLSMTLTVFKKSGH